MTETKARKSPEEQAALALEVMRRGQDAIPPGNWAAGVVVPCLCIGMGCFAFFVAEGAIFFAGFSQSLARSLAAILGLTLVLVSIALHVLVLLGKRRSLRVFPVYVRVFLALTLGSIAAFAVGGFRSRWAWAWGGVALIAIGAADRILHSWSYAAFAAFCSLRWKARADQLAARDRVLAEYRKQKQ